MISEKAMATSNEAVRPICTENIKGIVDTAVERAEVINRIVSQICEFLNAEAFKEYISVEHKRTDVNDLKTQLIQLIEVTESSADLIEIILDSLGM